MKIRNVSGQDLIVPGIGRLVLADQIVDVPDEDVDAYLCQQATWQPHMPEQGDDNGSEG